MDGKNLKIIFFGTSNFVIPVLEKLHREFEVIAVVTTEDTKVGRGHALSPSEVAKKASELDIPVFKPEKFDEELIQNLSQLEPDLFIVASYGKIIPKEVLNIPKHGALNIHPSLLPKYRGPSPIQAAILEGEEKSGITIIKMDIKADHGPIVVQEGFSLSNQDTFESLSKKMFQAGADILVDIVPDFIAGRIQPIAQKHSQATFTFQISKADGYFDLPAGRQVLDLQKLDRMIRAYFPWPTVWTKWKGKVVKFIPNQMIQIEGKKPTNLKSFLNGYKDFPLKEL